MKYLLVTVLALFTLPAAAQIEKADLNELLFGQGGQLYTHPEYGVSIGVINGNRVLYIASGRRTGRKLPIDSATQFEIGSVTKTFTGLLLAQQITAGRIGRKSYIDSYLPPRFVLQAPLRQKIRITDLASHQSGLPSLSSADDASLQALLRKNPVQPFSLVNEPYVYNLLRNTSELTGYGTYQYNNYAYALLGLLLQNVTHQPYQQLLQSSILAPCKLNHTGLGHYGSNNTAGRTSGDGKAKSAIVLNAVSPAGALISNAADMVRYLQLQINPPAGPAGKAIKLTRENFYSDNKHEVGLGWEIYPHYVEKSGDTFGNSSLLRFDTRHHIGIVVLSDHQDSKLVEDVADAVFKLLDKKG